MLLLITNKDTNEGVNWWFESGVEAIKMMNMVLLQLGTDSIEYYVDESEELFELQLTNRQLDRILKVLKKMKDADRLSELPCFPKDYLATIHSLRYGIDMLS